jgi:four helix bundle protein
MQRFTDLRVWQRSHALTVSIYRYTKTFPRDERYGVVAQLRRAASSVPTNISEGSKRERRFDYARFLNIAEGSLAETEYLLLLSHDLGYLENELFESLQTEARDIARSLHYLRHQVLETERRERKERRRAKTILAE